MKWSILLVKKNDNGWFINYIENKLIEQIYKNNLQSQVEVLIFNPNKEFFGEYVSLITEFIEISDNFIITIYNVLKNSNKDCIGLKGKIYIDQETFIFNNISKNKSEILSPITKLNPIRKNVILGLKSISNYLNCENLTSIVKTIDKLDEIVIFKEEIKNNIPVSIIITAYKSQDFIEECLDSVENQTYFIDNNNFEVLVGVDGCEDTYNKLQEIKHKYRNLDIYMMSENKGTYITTNTLIDLVKNEDVIRFDSDDIMTPSLVKEVIKNKNNNDIVILGCLDLRDGIIGSKFLMTEGIIYFKKSVMDNVAGGYMPWICSADSELISRLINKVKIYQLKKALFYRREHSKSLTNSKVTGYGSKIRKEYKNKIKNHYNDDEIKIERVVNDFTEKKINKNSISIIVTAYKSQDYIEECLDSIENQIYFKDNDDFEVLVGVDNCHDTLNKLKEISYKYRNLRIFMMNSNMGTYVTSNTLLDLVQYENILRFDSDDIMKNNMISEIILFTDYDIIKFKNNDFHIDVKKCSNNSNIFPDGVVLFKKNVFDLAGGYMPWRCAADTELLTRISDKFKIIKLDKYLYYRRVHDNSLTNKKDTGYNSELRDEYENKINSYINSDINIKINKIINSYHEIKLTELLKNNDSIQCIISRNIENNPFEPVKKMILDKYSNLSKYNNSLVILGYNRMIIEISEYRKMYPNKKIIIYQLEQLFDNKSQWYNKYSDKQWIIDSTNNIKRRLSECDEIWDYDLDNINFLKSEGYKNIKHVPLEYTETLIRNNSITTPKYDLLFFGSINDRRAKILSFLSKKYKICIIAPKNEIVRYGNYNFGEYVVESKFNDELFDYIFNSKIIINIHYYESKLLEQVRIFELLINNKIIVSEKSRKNYYENLIYEFDNNDELVDKIDFILKNEIWKNFNVSEKFKNINSKKTRVLVTTASFGTPLKSKWVHQITDDKYEIVFNRLSSDNNFSKKLSMSPRLRAKSERMLMWELYPGYDYYIWLDSSFSILRTDSIQWIIDQCTNDVDAVFFKHSQRDSVGSEFNFVYDELKKNNKYLLDRYYDEPLVEEINSYYLDSNFKDNFLIESGLFIYRNNIVQNKNYNIMKEWYYHNCKWTTLDQLSLPYLLQKFEIKYKFFDTTIYKNPYFKFIHWQS